MDAVAYKMILTEIYSKKDSTMPAALPIMVAGASCFVIVCAAICSCSSRWISKLFLIGMRGCQPPGIHSRVFHVGR